MQIYWTIVSVDIVLSLGRHERVHTSVLVHLLPRGQFYETRSISRGQLRIGSATTTCSA